MADMVANEITGKYKDLIRFLSNLFYSYYSFSVSVRACVVEVCVALYGHFGGRDDIMPN